MRKLIKVLTPERLSAMGFTMNEDKEDPRGTDWTMTTTNFLLHVDAWCDVTLCRVNPDTDPITLSVDTVFELQRVVDWIED